LPSRNAAIYFGDILKAIQRIADFIGPMNFEHYTEDEKTASAVERQLLIVTEASIRLNMEDRDLCPDVEWQDMRNLGNRLRHVYHDVDNELIWNIVQEDLPQLKRKVEQTLRDHFPDANLQ
jgi:uncharacterized protein with HEPN domain